MKFSLEKSLIYFLIILTVFVFGFVFYLFLIQPRRSIQLEIPNGTEEWEIERTYQISWKSKGIEKIGIVLFKGSEPQWIARNINAREGKYDWKIYPGQEIGDDYWVAIFEYPWQEGNKIDYSDEAFAIIYPKSATCEELSISKEWPHLPNDFPNLRRVFITSEKFTGDLGGLAGADQKCQKEAQDQGLGGNWLAFLGGDSEENFAIERLKKTPRKIEGIFIEAKPAATLPSGKTCHHLLGKDFNDFLEKFSNSLIINQVKLEKDFLDNLGNLWLGRLDEKSKKDCLTIETKPYKPLAEKYSFTTTCQNWTQGGELVSGYPVPPGGPEPEFPACYTPEGKVTSAVALGGLSSGILGKEITNKVFTSAEGKYCNLPQKLLCIEQ